MMRILFILHQFYPEFKGGTERVALSLAKSAQRAGHYSHVLACAIEHVPRSVSSELQINDAIHTVQSGVPVTFLKKKALPLTADFSFETDLQLSNNLSVWMKNASFNIVHLLHPMRMASTLLAIQKCKIPYIVTLTDFFFMCFKINMVDNNNQLCPGPMEGMRCAQKCLCHPWSKESLERRYLLSKEILSAAGDRVCPSNYVARNFRKAFPSLKFTVIPHGIDICSIMNDKRNTCHKHSDLLIFGYIGAIIPQKGLLTLLRAFTKVHDPKLKLIIVGGFYGDHSYHSEVKNLIKTDPRIELLGEVHPQDVAMILKKIDVICLPSQVPETFSLVINEAAALGVPSLVSDLGAPSERVLESGCGKVIPAGSIEAWSEALQELVSNPEIINAWKKALPVPLRIEEEAFFYESLYRRLIH